jgi:hypothetical protein
MNPISTTSAGLLSGFARFESASVRLTSGFDAQSAADPASAIADQITASEQVYASTATLGVEDRMLKQLLDIRV